MPRKGERSVRGWDFWLPIVGLTPCPRCGVRQGECLDRRSPYKFTIKPHRERVPRGMLW